VTSCGLDRELQELVEHHAVGQVRQAVMGRQILDLPVGARFSSA
jgi:hypothetical protein